MPKITDYIMPAEEVPYAGAQDALERAAKGLKASKTALAAAGIPQVRGYLTQALDKAGATLESAARVIAEAQGADHETPGFFEGQVVSVHKQPDHRVRLKAGELNLRARGELKDQETTNIFMGLSDADLAKIASGALDPAQLLDLGPRAGETTIEADVDDPAEPSNG